MRGHSSKISQGLFTRLPDKIIINIYEYLSESDLQAIMQCSGYDRVFALLVLIERDTKEATDLKMQLFMSWIADPRSFMQVKSNLEAHAEHNVWINILKKSYYARHATVIYRALCTELIIMLDADARHTMIESQRKLIQSLDKEIGLHQFQHIENCDYQFQILLFILMRYLPPQRISACIKSWRVDGKKIQSVNTYFMVIFVLRDQLSLQQILSKKIDIDILDYDSYPLKKFKSKSKFYSSTVRDKINVLDSDDISCIVKKLISFANCRSFENKYIFLCIIDGITTDIVKPHTDSLIKVLCSLLDSKSWEIRIYAARIVVDKKHWIADQLYQQTIVKIIEFIKIYMSNQVSSHRSNIREHVRNIDVDGHIKAILNQIPINYFQEYVKFIMDMNFYSIYYMEELLFLSVKCRYDVLDCEHIKKIIDLIYKLFYFMVENNDIHKSILRGIVNHIFKHADHVTRSYLIDQLVMIIKRKPEDEFIEYFVHNILVEHRHQLSNDDVLSLQNIALYSSSFESVQCHEISIRYLRSFGIMPNPKFLEEAQKSIYDSYDQLLSQASKESLQLDISSICNGFMILIPYLDDESIRVFHHRVLSINRLYTINSLVVMINIFINSKEHTSLEIINGLIDSIVHNIQYMNVKDDTISLGKAVSIFCRTLTKLGHIAKVCSMLNKLLSICKNEIIPAHHLIVYIMPFASVEERISVSDRMRDSLTSEHNSYFNLMYFNFVCENYSEFEICYVRNFLYDSFGLKADSQSSEIDVLFESSLNRVKIKNISNLIEIDAELMTEEFMNLLLYYLPYCYKKNESWDTINLLRKFPLFLLQKISHMQLYIIICELFESCHDRSITTIYAPFIKILNDSSSSITDDVFTPFFGQIMEYIGSSDSDLVSLACEMSIALSARFTVVLSDHVLRHLIEQKLLMQASQSCYLSIYFFNKVSVELQALYLANISSSDQDKSGFMNQFILILDDVFHFIFHDDYRELLAVIIDIHHELPHIENRIKLTLALQQHSTYSSFAELEESTQEGLEQSAGGGVERGRECCIS